MMTWIKSALESAVTLQKSKVSWLDGHLPIFIYGTGTFAQDIHRVLVDNGLPVQGFLDHMEREFPTVNGVTIYTPEKASQLKSGKTKAVVVLGIHNYQANIPRIIEKLSVLGFQKVLSSVDLYDFFGQALGTRYWLTSREYYFSLQTILNEVHTLWADEISKAIFRAVMEFRLTGDAEKLLPPDLINLYHPQDLPKWKTPLRFIDCGAFEGDTLSDFIKNRIKIAATVAFEPDSRNFTKLSHFVSSHKRNLPEITLFPCGVYSSTKQLTFETGQGMASNISSKGATVIQCVALDDAIPTFAPNLIKMDIEGVEYEALLGARQIISAHTPGLAISLYHRPEHLWQLPILVENIAPGKYRFYLRSHALNDFELVLYALPRE